MKRSFIREILDVVGTESISFAGGLPDKTLFPIESFQEAANKLHKTPQVFQYAPTQGLEELRELIAKDYSNKGFDTSSENILITSGSQQGLYLLSSYFQNRAILVESPSYLGARQCFARNGLKTKPMRLFEYDMFSKIFEKTELAYLIPDFQNPSGYCYGIKQREFIAQTIKESEGILIEDAPYSELYFEKPFESISSKLPQNSFHLGSFSKTVAPGFRLGWIRADKKLLQPLVAIKESIDLHSCTVSQQITFNFLSKEDRYQSHLQKIRKNYKEKMEFFAKTLEEKLPDFDFDRPKGGMFIYGRLKGYDTKKLVYKAIDKGVAFVPGSEFYDNSGGKDEIRFNFTATDKDQVKKGIEILSSIL